jgi:hypothetical protein
MNVGLTKAGFSTVSLLLLGLVSGSANADDIDAHETEMLEHRHHIAVFLGNTHTEHDEDAFTIGLDYEYRLTALLGIGALGEHAVKDIDTWVFGVPLALHPGAGWRLVAMPGIEVHDGETEFLIRAGVGYEFEIDRLTIMPEFSADFVDSEVNLGVGVSLGVKF